MCIYLHTHGLEQSRCLFFTQPASLAEATGQPVSVLVSQYDTSRPPENAFFCSPHCPRGRGECIACMACLSCCSVVLVERPSPCIMRRPRARLPACLRMACDLCHAVALHMDMSKTMSLSMRVRVRLFCRHSINKGRGKGHAGARPSKSGLCLKETYLGSLDGWTLHKESRMCYVMFRTVIHREYGWSTDGGVGVKVHTVLYIVNTY